MARTTRREFMLGEGSGTGGGPQNLHVGVGPAHPAMHGIIRIVTELDGETIVNADVEIGYLHRAFEKDCEQGGWNNAIPYTDRLNYVSPLINNFGYASAVEKLLGIDVTERCKYIRVIMSEISRICDHLTCVGASSMELGAFTVFLYMIKAREFLWELVEDVTGARLTISYGRVGGVKADLPDGFAEKTLHAFKQTREVLDEVHRLLTGNRIFMDRMVGVGMLSREETIGYAITGPLLRAVGVPYDVRRAQPYYVYDRMEFEVPTQKDGDNYARYLVRMAEMEQSMRIAEQCLEKMPAGPVMISDSRFALPPKRDVYNSIEGLMNHFKIVMEGIRVPAGEVYQAVEGANGELGFYLVSDGSGRPYRVRVRPPCFFGMAALGDLLKGLMVADIITTFGMINMIGGECDR